MSGMHPKTVYMYVYNLSTYINRNIHYIYIETRIALIVYIRKNYFSFKIISLFMGHLDGILLVPHSLRCFF